MNEQLDKQPPNLSTMPTPVLNLIMRDFDFMEIGIFRKVCRHLRAHVDSSPRDLQLKCITVHKCSSNWNVIRSQLEYITLNYTTSTRETKHDYSKYPNGCKIAEKKFLKNLDFASVSGNDLGLTLRHQKSVLTRITLVFPQNSKLRLSETCLETFGGRFLAVLEPHLQSRSCLLRTKEFRIFGTNQESQIMKILQYLDPVPLNEIFIFFHRREGFTSPTLKIEKLVEMEQWKKARIISIDGLNLAAGLHCFVHLMAAKIELKQISPEDLVMLKETFLHRPSFVKKFFINYRHFKNQKNFISIFGNPFSVDEKNIAFWYFNAPNSSENALEVSWNKKRKLFVVEATPRQYVPDGALM